MGGIGKTCIAKEVFNQVFHKFEGSCFLESVKQKFDDVKGITRLQRQLLSETLTRKHEKIESIDRGLNVIQERLRHKRVLIVLDDIAKINQITRLLGSHNWLCPGSRVIITTRIKDLLQPVARYQQYEVKELNICQSLQLLSLHAFDNGHPSEDYIDCATSLVKYAGGIPLAIELLGSSLRGEGTDVWNRRLNKLKVISHEDIHSKLELSYDALDDSEKSLFLDIACFFVGKKKNFVISILDDSDSFATDGFNSLMKRCLVKVDSDSKLQMHDLIRDMGREIVRRESPRNPGKRSRLWRHEDVNDVLTYETGTEVVEGLVIDLPKLKHSPNSEAFKEMKLLRLLKLNYVHLTGSYKHIPKRLRWLCWFEFPLPSIPNEFNLQNLVNLDLRYSCLKKFSDEAKFLAKLKFLNLSYSRDLAITPNFEGFSSLEKLVLKDCTSLAEVHDSIWHATGLVLLNLQNCKSLKTLSTSICSLQSLEKLNISGCSSLQQLPEDLGNLISLVELLADGTAISTIPESIGNLKELRSLSLQDCPLIFSISQAIKSFLPNSLRKLDLGYCNIIDDMIPHDLEGLFLLEELRLSGNRFTHFPVGMSRLPNLHTLWLDQCKSLQSIPQLQSSVLKLLHAEDCSSLVSINLVNNHTEPELKVTGCPNLREVKGFFSMETLNFETLENILRAEVSFTQESMAGIHVRVMSNLTQTCLTSPVQSFSEQGKFSIFLPGRDVPGWFSHQKEGNIVSFSVSQPEKKKLMGFATCVIYAWGDHETVLYGPLVVITNKTKELTWADDPCMIGFCERVGEDVMWLCYWMFNDQSDDLLNMWYGMNETEEGDEMELEVTIGLGISIRKCGIHPLYEQCMEPTDLALVANATTRNTKTFVRPNAVLWTFECTGEVKAERNNQSPRCPRYSPEDNWSFHQTIRNTAQKVFTVSAPQIPNFCNINMLHNYLKDVIVKPSIRLKLESSGETSSNSTTNVHSEHKISLAEVLNISAQEMEEARILELMRKISSSFLENNFESSESIVLNDFQNVLMQTFDIMKEMLKFY